MNKELIKLSENETFRRRVETNFYNNNGMESAHKTLSFNDGGGSYMNFVTQDQFNEYKEHVNTRFDNVDKILDKIENDTSSTKGNVKWLIGLSITALVSLIGGFAAIIVNLL